MDRWRNVIDEEMQKSYCQELDQKVRDAYNAETCYPPYTQILYALEMTHYEDAKVVILGQDPYHEPNQAMGLSFSVLPGTAIPRSLQNIYKELKDELGCYIPNNGDLTKWAKQGVLMLNSVLSVAEHKPMSHEKFGWETFTDRIISELNNKDTPVVFLLWGNFARNKKALITNPIHHVLEAPHPSPYSANYGFFGCGHFKTCNDILTANNLTPIDWQIENI